MKKEQTSQNKYSESRKWGYASVTRPLPQDGFGFDDEEFEDEEDEDFGQQRTNMRAKGRTQEDGEAESKTPHLDAFGTDLSSAAEKDLLDPVVGRQDEIERVAQILSRRKKNNPILIGEPGVGKSAIAEGLALRIAQHKIARSLWQKRVVVLDMAAVVAGTKYRGQFEERMRGLIQELKDNPQIIIFIDEIHTLVGAGSASGTMDAANLLKPALSRGEIQCIGATTLKEFHKSIEKDGALERRFQKVIVSPTTKEQTLEILKNLKSRYEEHHNVSYTPEALEACVNLADRYVSDRCFPDKAIDVMDETGSCIHIQDVPIPADILHLEHEVQLLNDKKNEAVKTQNFELAADYRDQLEVATRSLEQRRIIWEAQLKENRMQIDAETVATVVARMTGIPVQHIGSEENQRLREMSDHLKKRVIGQEEAIETLVRSIQRSRVGLKDPNRPIGVFLFVGPTGVGKTHLTKVLAKEVFGSEDALIRVDMSEYMEKHNVSRMVGAPPGYVGYEEGGELTEKVRHKPYSVILLDEIEKAHRDVFNMLLQVMDEGRLTDGNGDTIDFKNTIIIMTSNSGTREVKDFGKGIGFGTANSQDMNNEKAKSLIQKSLQRQFAPEFINRLDQIVFFNALNQEAIERIVDIELKPLEKRTRQLGYTLEVSPEAKELLCKAGCDVQYGARPLKRAIEHMLEDSLTQTILDGAAKGSTLRAIAKEEKIEIEVNK
ncbi:MAG: ATP-dependent Clp protease ATP-binding subunit [Bacteroidaceae bacterium]|nr:ATP-dependent Clp protease ATP-binding subunit [Prevotellaceae bacterium]MDY5632934.1 ATP-dependent Clp protease ATP-binding subunit [Bacteroidaceae bacterium]